jgi:hypothetical protein
MSNSVFTEASFWAMVAVSVVLPFGIYGWMLATRSISRTSVLVLGFLLIALAGLDVYFLQKLATHARLTPSLADDGLFLSELSVALYLLPATFGGLGINVVSNVLTSHLADAQRRFDKEHGER